MITLLAKLFIKDRKGASDAGVRQIYGILCGIVGITLNILLFAGKFIAGSLSNSIAITADAFNNLSDAGSSLITLIGFRMAGHKPDPGHPFGHGRIEYLSGLFVSIAILLMSVELIQTSADKIKNPQPVNFGLLPALILCTSILVKLYMAFYNRKIGNKLNSTAMKATSMDSFSDMLATSVVLISMFIGHFTGLKIDGYCGIAVGLFIFYAGCAAARDTISPLLGQPPRPEFVADVGQIVMSYSAVLGIHDLVVHDYGPGRIMLSLHAEVPATGDMVALHDTIDNIEHHLHHELNCEAVIHMDPVAVNDELTNALKQTVSKIIQALDPQIQFHDFRVVKGPTHTNLIFDIVIPYDYPKSDQDITDLLQEQIHQADPACFAVIQVDKSYIEQK